MLSVTQRSVLGQTFFSQRWKYAFAIGTTTITTLFAFSIPLVIQLYLDTVFGTEPLPPFRLLQTAVSTVGGVEVLRQAPWYGALAIVALTIGSGGSAYLTARLTATAAEDGARRLRDRLYRHLQATSLAFHNEHATGDLTQRCTSDIDTIRRFFAIQIGEIGRAIALVAIAVPIMVRLSLFLSLVALGAIPLLLLISFFFYKRVQAAFLASDEAEGELSARIQEHLAGIRVVRAFGRQRYEQDRFDEDNGNYRSITYRMVRLLALYWTVNEGLGMIQLGAVVVTSVFLANQGAMTVGTLLVFWMLEMEILWPIRQMGRVLADLGKASVAANRIAEVLDAPEEDDDPRAGIGGSKTPRIKGAVQFENVSFSYPDGTDVLRNVSFSVPAGVTVGILGPTGSGKTTLMMLLDRLYDYSSGSIRIDGVELREIDRKTLRRNVGYVLQEPFLFAKSIKDNLGLAKNNANDAELFAAARAAAIHDVIEGFDRGYDTAVGERGVTLSGGQKQRLAIARALLMEPAILIFDDSLSAVDTHTDQQIREALAERRAAGNAPTTFIVSHRVTTLGQTDFVIVIEGGRVVEIGAPDQLVRQNGHYHRVWQLQKGTNDAEFPRSDV